MSRSGRYESSESAIVPANRPRRRTVELERYGGYDGSVGPRLWVRRLRFLNRGRPQLRTPMASIGLYAIGQLILTLAIAVGRIGPIAGIAICLLWMVCGLLLVAAQVASDRVEVDDGDLDT